MSQGHVTLPRADRYNATVMRAILHILAHFLVPALVVLFLSKKQRLPAWLVLVSTMAVDLDHLLANPIYAPNRCSIGFHPLHTYPAIAAYILALVLPRVPKPVRLAALGLCLHMGLDQIDCWMM